ncbi:MAG: response regulator, partial [Methanoregula sp.]|nr:response regulator [Methanoregula sp.]
RYTGQLRRCTGQDDCKKYDVVIAGYPIPVMDGITFLRYTRHTYRNIPIILFTGKWRVEVVIEAINNGAHCFLRTEAIPQSAFHIRTAKDLEPGTE